MPYQHIFKKHVKYLLLLLILTSPYIQATAESMPEHSGLPRYSTLIPVNHQSFHVRAMAPDATGATSPHLPVVILISGPNQNFYADSAWFSLIQPLLAKTYQVYAIDRLGNGFSDDATDVSYRRFSQDLVNLLPELTDQPVLLVSFASASISARLLMQYPAGQQVKGMLWIDPDIPTPQALALYKGYPVDWYQQNLQQLLPELAKGVWNQRTLDKLSAERIEVTNLLNRQSAEKMDWDYFDAINRQRQTPQRQRQRAIEIANYAKDLDLYAALPALTNIPISVIDSDFETADIESAPEQAALLRQWQQQGSVWSQQLAENSGGQYLPLHHSHHLVMFQHPEKILTAVDWLSAKVSASSNQTAMPTSPK